MRFPEWVKMVVLMLAVTFAWVVLTEGYVHHHSPATASQDCAYCQFHKNISNSHPSLPPLNLIPLFLVLFLAFGGFTAELPSFRTQPTGRAPPSLKTASINHTNRL